MATQTPETGSSLSTDTLRERLQAALPQLRERYAVERLALHGSRLRGEAHPASDLDVLVDFSNDEAGRQVSLLGFLALKYELEDLLGVPIDLGEGQALRGPAAENIRREAEPVQPR